MPLRKSIITSPEDNDNLSKAFLSPVKGRDIRFVYGSEALAQAFLDYTRSQRVGVKPLPSITDHLEIVTEATMAPTMCERMNQLRDKYYGND